jgi:hypothetical protein
MEEVEEVKDVEAAPDLWPERKRYGEAVEAENIYGGMAAIEVPLLNTESLTVGDLQSVVQEVVGQSMWLTKLWPPQATSSRSEAGKPSSKLRSAATWPSRAC